MLRYRQTRFESYHQTILEEAEKYHTEEVRLAHAVWPGTVGDAVLLMLNANELTGEPRYLVAADRFARTAVELFLNGDSPLPKASHIHDHYEAVTNGDTLMLALLKLWLAQNPSDFHLDLVYTDR